MKKILILLFDSINESEIESIISEGSFSHICNLSKNPLNNNFGLLKYDLGTNIEAINKDAQNTFVEFIRQTSIAKFRNGKDVRQYTVSNLPLYWLTEYSEKHPYNHYLYGILLLQSLLKRGVLSMQEITIYCPPRYTFLQSLLFQLFPKEVLRVFKKRNRSEPRFIRFFRTNLITIIKILRQRTYSKSMAKLEPNSLVYFRMSNQTSHVDRIIAVFNEKGINKENPVVQIDHNAYVSGKKMDQSLLACRPTLIELLGVFSKLIWIKIRLRSEQIIIEDTKFNSDFLMHELNAVISHSPHKIYSYLWLRNFFNNQSSKIKVLYEDEFYVSGRVISAAKINSDNENISTYGIQHGMFSDNHTVYNISDIELHSTLNDRNNGMPIPDFFITWGTFFTDFFLKHNSLGKRYIMEFGNPLFVFNSTQTNNTETDSISGPKKILYCLTSSKLFYDELALVNRILEENDNCELIIRHHPNFKFDVDKALFKNCKSVKISSETSLLNDLSDVSYVLTSAHSTIFMDALSCGKSVIRLKTSIYDETMDNKYKDCITIDSSYDGILDLNEIFNTSSKNSIMESFLYLDSDRWLRFLN